jgi:hypothetical protein
MGDAKFSDSLELMTFLANLVGSEHIERFIPVADPATERSVGHDTQNAPTVEAPGPAASGTREMPKFIAGTQREPPASGTAQVARTERKAKAPPVKPAPAPPAAPSSSESASAGQGPSEDVREQVIADAVRLVQWGRKWYELAEVIAKMADRPHLTDVRRILKDNKAVIDKRAGRG